MTSWKGIKDKFNRKCSRADFADAHTEEITEEERDRLKASAQARMKLKRYFLQDSTDGSVLTDGSNSTEEAIDDDLMQNLPQLEPLPVEADHDPAVDVGSTSNVSRLPSPVHQSPPSASSAKVRRQDCAKASSKKKKASLPAKQSHLENEMHAPVDSLSTRGQDPPAGTSSTFVQQPSNATSKTQVQSSFAATAPAVGPLSKTQRKKLRLANSCAKPLPLKCRTCGLSNHLRRACLFPNPFPKGVKKPPPIGLEPPSSSTDVNVVAKWTEDALRMFPHDANASNKSVKKK